MKLGKSALSRPAVLPAAPVYVPDSDFRLKESGGDIAIDMNFAAQSFWRDVFIRYFRKISAVIGLVLIILISVMAAVGPGMNAYTYSEQSLSRKNFAPRVKGLENLGIFDGDEAIKTTAGSKMVNQYKEKNLEDVYYWFGSDNFGRDIWTRTWSGARVSLIIAVAAAVIDMVIGMSYGLVSGYFGGRVDMVLQRILEVVNGIPRLVIVTLLLLVLQPGMLTIIFALMLTEWVGMSRIARAEMLKLKEQEFVLASRTLGAGSFFIIFREILPNIMGPIITQVMFSIPTAIFTEAFLSFVGLGIPVPRCSLGSLISEGFNSFTTHPYQIIPPIVVMALLMLSFNLAADGLREALDPKLKKGEVICNACRKEQILRIRDLDITFRTTAGPVHAIRGVNIDLMKGETAAIVGESGSGKSVTMKAAMGILASNAVVGKGTIEFSYRHTDGTPETVDILKKDKKWIRKHINGKRIAMVFQDPMTSLDPTMSVGKQIMEGMIWHFKTPKKEAWDRAVELLKEVGIEDAEKRMKNYPHQLSGGMRQRVVIAIALACNPDLLICDEPTTALDVTIQAKIIELIRRIQRERGISVIYITHDLGVVAKVADYVNVMYAGKIVEKGQINEIFYDPRHPYTWGLLSAMPDLDTDDERLYTIPGSPPNLLKEQPGDAFAPRNQYALVVDDKAEPPMFKITESHYAATWLLDPRAPKVEMPKELKARIARMKKEAKEYGGEL